jgi:predicted ATPase
MIYLRSIALRNVSNKKEYPFNLPFIEVWETLVLPKPVTFFVGENGSGKSTLMEAVACGVGSITIGSENVRTDPTLEAVRRLAANLQLCWNKKTKQEFFLRAEDFFGYIKRLSIIRAELESDLNRVAVEYENRSDFAHGQARIPFERELHDLKNR